MTLNLLKFGFASTCVLFSLGCTNPAEIERERFLGAISSNDIILLEAFTEDYPNSKDIEKIKERISILNAEKEAQAWVGKTAKKTIKGNAYIALSGRYEYNVSMTGIVESYDDGRVKVLINDVEMLSNVDNIFAKRGFNDTYGNTRGKSQYWELDDKMVEIVQ